MILYLLCGIYGIYEIGLVSGDLVMVVGSSTQPPRAGQGNVQKHARSIVA